MRQTGDDLVLGQKSRVEPNDTPNSQDVGRVLIAGEFANDWGHLGCMLAMARAYRAAGHEVLLAVSDLSAAQFFFAADDFPLLQAPVLRVARQPMPHQGDALNFADLLWGLGYADPVALAAATEAWIVLLTGVSPKLLVYVNAPTAVLAARALNIPTLFVGGAFDIPPAMPPLPAFRRSVDFPEQELALTRETEVVENINAALSRFRRPAIKHLGELFPADGVRLTTFPELDHFGPRFTEKYIGPIFALPTVRRVGWKDADAGIRIFAYLHPLAPSCENVLQALNSLEAEILCVMPGCSAQWLARFERITFYDKPLELAFLLPRAHLVVTGGVMTTATALLVGLPIFSVPRTLEQQMLARELRRYEASITVEMSDSVEIITKSIGALLEKENYRQAAMRMAVKYLRVKFEDNAQLLTRGLQR